MAIRGYLATVLKHSRRTDDLYVRDIRRLDHGFGGFQGAGPAGRHHIFWKSLYSEPIMIKFAYYD
jgi:hypothetical protein